MIHEKQRKKLIAKLQRLAEHVDPLFFSASETITDLSVYETDQRLFNIPSSALYHPISQGGSWGREGSYAWFHCDIEINDRLAGQGLYIFPVLGGYEGMLYVNGKPKGAFAEKIVVTTHGNHYCCLLDSHPQPGTRCSIDLEYYAGHHVPGTQPFENGNGHDFTYTFQEIRLCRKNQAAIDFAVSLKTLLEIYGGAQGHPYWKEALYYLFENLNAIAPYSLEQLHSMEEINDFFFQANNLMEPFLAKKACESDGQVFLSGHSHMDTAWLWPRAETVKKCGRTMANALNYMEQYPEYHFLFSAPCHMEMIRDHYPSIYETMKQRIREGRLEPNGGSYIESDCNIPSGESLLRQFLWAQKYTMQEFGYRADCFWLPDTFGYSASIPQIMKGCGLQYFLTTKLSWNDTNQFPYESFWWQGIDGTKVLTHFNVTQDAPSPAYTIRSLEPQENYFKTGTRFFAFGQGDGGGGPDLQMIESARRSMDILGAPRAQYGSLSHFMEALEKNPHLPLYEGELYLELHRATLTNQPAIKKNNRRAEILHHDLELLICLQAMQEGSLPDISRSNPYLKTILINQFHDILPGTCIQSAHEECMDSMKKALDGMERSIEEILRPQGSPLLFNPLGFPRRDTVRLWIPENQVPALPCWQTLEIREGHRLVAVEGLSQVPFSACRLETVPDSEAKAAGIPFHWDGCLLDTPFYRVRFDDSGWICQLYDKEESREISSPRGRLGSLTVCENIPAMWDSWDIDADSERRFHPCVPLEKSVMEEMGPVLCSFRCSYRLGPNSTASVKTIFYAQHRAIDFETQIHAEDANLFAGAEFYHGITASEARFEIQYGHVRRPLHRNDFVRQAAFEVCHHRYCDVSEAGYGLSLINDCKYGIHPEPGLLRLSLHYGAAHPDSTASFGDHSMRYRLLPHQGSFSAETTVRDAYCFNSPSLPCGENALGFSCPVSVEQPNVILETLKPCEEKQSAVILRLYESEGRSVHADLHFDSSIVRVQQVDMLEENPKGLSLVGSHCRLSLSPFEVKTLKLCFHRK